MTNSRIGVVYSGTKISATNDDKISCTHSSLINDCDGDIDAESSVTLVDSFRWWFDISLSGC